MAEGHRPSPVASSLMVTSSDGEPIHQVDPLELVVDDDSEGSEQPNNDVGEGADEAQLDSDDSTADIRHNTVEIQADQDSGDADPALDEHSVHLENIETNNEHSFAGEFTYEYSEQSTHGLKGNNFIILK